MRRAPTVLKAATLVCLVALLRAAPAQAQVSVQLSDLFEKTEVSIPMRDGVHLHTRIYRPKNSSEPLPFLLTRSPYGFDYDEQGFPRSLSREYKELADERYIFVFQDIRGRFRSEGKFVMLRPVRDESDPKAVDESTDTYDTVEWLINHVPNSNRRVGVLGISYGGWLTVMAMIDPHPAIKAVSPQASPSDMFIGDDFYHNGAFRLDFSFEYVAWMERSKTFTPFGFSKNDIFEWYVDLGPLANVNKVHLNGEVPTWNDFMTHATYDEFWKKRAVPPFLGEVAVPTLNIAGWWDAEDFYGPLEIYKALEEKDDSNMNYLVVGPWRHGGWARDAGDSLRKVNFGSPTGQYFREKIQAPWFAYFLKDKGKLDLPEALVFQTGTNRWKSYEQWPPRKDTTARNLYLGPSSRLSFQPPEETGEQAVEAYVSDPSHPVPYVARPIKPALGLEEGDWPYWRGEDQRFAHLRPDVLSWQTDALQEDLCIAGDVVADLFASTSGTDSDWVVKLIDVYPQKYSDQPDMGGYQLMIADEVFRAKFRNSYVKPEPVVPNQATEYTIDLRSHDHCFLAGHQIMVQVQSSWFPLIDRNPQTFIAIPSAQESDFQKATQRVFRSKKFPSHIRLFVEERE